MVIAEAELGLCMMSVPMQQSKKIMKKLELNELNEKSKIDMQNVKTDRQLATGTMEWRRSLAFSFLFSAVATQRGGGAFSILGTRDEPAGEGGQR